MIKMKKAFFVTTCLASILATSSKAHSEPVCLGLDPSWENHGWYYTTQEGIDWGACGDCHGPWETVPEWVAGLEVLCDSTGWEPAPVSQVPTLQQVFEELAPDEWAIMRPAYDWPACQELIFRCSAIPGC